MVRREVARCPLCLPLPYGPVYVRTGPSSSCPSEPSKHKHTKVGVKLEVKVTIEVKEADSLSLSICPSMYLYLYFTYTLRTAWSQSGQSIRTAHTPVALGWRQDSRGLWQSHLKKTLCRASQNGIRQMYVCAQPKQNGEGVGKDWSDKGDWDTEWEVTNRDNLRTLEEKRMDR